MDSERILTRSMIGFLTAAIIGLGYNQMRARADGIPAAQTLTYAGTLEESNAPVNGVRNLRLTLWDDATSTMPSRVRCLTEAPNYAVTNGRFQVTLDSTCTAAVRATPDLWMEIQVNGVSMGRSKLGAVPFAVEAARASELTLTAANQLVPPGTVVAFAGESAPSGWLLCDGSEVSRTTYAALFAAVGTAHGTGSTGSTFRLPDLRGRFVRGAARDSASDRDPDRAMRIAANAGGSTGNAVGSLQTAATGAPATAFVTGAAGSHAHGGTTGAVTGGAGAPVNPALDYATGPSSSPTGFSYLPLNNLTGANLFRDHIHLINADGQHTHPITGGDRETRPVNIAMNYIIRF